MHIKKRLFSTIIFLLSIICQTLHTKTPIGNSWHFNTTILRNKKKTKQNLIQKDGFIPVSFKSKDNTILAGLFLKRKNPKATILFFHGFFPGGKEVFAPFVKIAPDTCNLLFIDMRGFGESKGSNIYLHIKNYCLHEYNDIIGAMTFIKKETNGLPQILLGRSSGAFNAATALLKLHKKKKYKQYNVKGLVFDSGFGSILHMTQSPYYHIRHHLVPRIISPLYGGNKQRASTSILCKISSYCLSLTLKVVEFYLLPTIKQREPQTNLFDTIHKLDSIPIFAIHAIDDHYSHWKHIKPLIENIKQKDLWLIPKGTSSHAKASLKQKELYKNKLYTWIKKALQT